MCISKMGWLLDLLLLFAVVRMRPLHANNASAQACPNSSLADKRDTYVRRMTFSHCSPLGILFYLFQFSFFVKAQTLVSQSTD